MSPHAVIVLLAIFGSLFHVTVHAASIKGANQTWAFIHGVSSGDPLPTRIIAWTRVTWTGPAGKQPNFVTLLLRVVPSTSNYRTYEKKVVCRASSDFTCKYDVTALKAGVPYKYSFTVLGAGGGAVSPTGRFKLPYPMGDPRQSSLRYAVLSCANWGWGYFHAYAEAARYNLDFWLHLGDFIYEVGNDIYPTPTQAVRGGLLPTTELRSLADYRQRYALYRGDPELQALAASAPAISIWDDHEFANNAWSGGAAGHDNATEGPWELRVAAAVQAYHEWMPIRSRRLDGSYVGTHINRTFHFGSLASLFVTEERITARSEDLSAFQPIIALAAAVGRKAPSQWGEVELAQIAAVKAEADRLRSLPTRRRLGPEQLAWLEAETKKSARKGITWQLYGTATTLQDLVFDPSGAIRAANATDPALAATWRQLLDNVTSGAVALLPNGTPTNRDTIRSYGTTCFRRPVAGFPLRFNLSDANPASPLGAVNFGLVAGLGRAVEAAALGRVDVGELDRWSGFPAERDAVLSIAKQANNAVFYGGDTHNDWAAVAIDAGGDVVAAEFDTAAVTAPGNEEQAFMLPPDFIAAIQTAGGGMRGGLRFSHVALKGFVFVTLDAKSHHAEFIKVNTHCVPTGWNATCIKAFDRHTAAERKARRLANDIQDVRCMTDRQRAGPASG